MCRRIDPLTYESIVLPEGGHRRLKLYERAFRSKPKEFYGRSVRRIFTKNNLKRKSSDLELGLLWVCDNLVTLECRSDPREELSAILKTKFWPSLRTLCINIDLLPKDENTFHLPLFRNVTHLDLFSDEPQLPSWKSLESLENLTHLHVCMLVNTEYHLVRLGIDQAYAIATEAQKCFPPNLEYFVILVPSCLLYRVCHLDRETIDFADEERWKWAESLRCGTFDPRIMFGCYSDLGSGYDINYIIPMAAGGKDVIQNMAGCTGVAPILDVQESVAWEDRERKWSLAL